VCACHVGLLNVIRSSDKHVGVTGIVYTAVITLLSGTRSGLVAVSCCSRFQLGSATEYLLTSGCRRVPVDGLLENLTVIYRRFIFRPHRLHAVHRCGLLLKMSQVAWSSCVSVCTYVCMCAVQRMNRSRCRLGADYFTSPCLWNQLPLSLRQPHSSTSYSISDSPIPSPTTSSSSDSPLCSSMTPCIRN